MEDRTKWCVCPKLRVEFELTRCLDSALLALGLTQTCFEGSMYLFVFAWVPSLQEVSGPFADLPLGYIFSAFMVSMMLGSVMYTFITATASIPQTSNVRTGDSALTLHAKLSSLVCTVSAFALAASVVTYDAREAGQGQPPPDLSAEPIARHGSQCWCR